MRQRLIRRLQVHSATLGQTPQAHVSICAQQKIHLFHKGKRYWRKRCCRAAAGPRQRVERVDHVAVGAGTTTTVMRVEEGKDDLCEMGRGVEKRH